LAIAGSVVIVILPLSWLSVKMLGADNVCLRIVPGRVTHALTI
jgi:hypothetical protein